MQTMIDKKNKNEIMEIINFALRLDNKDKSDFCQFIRGAEYGYILATSKKSEINNNK